MAYLIVSKDGQELARRILKRPLVVGRSEQADLPVQDSSVSRRHCRFERVDRGWMVVDLDSHNGTRIAGSRIHKHVLKDGESLEVGDTTLRFCAGAFESRRPADPREAELRARMENSVESSSDSTIGLSGRKLPTPRLKPAQPARPKRRSDADRPVAFARPKPAPRIAGVVTPSVDQPSSPPSLFSRLLGRRR